MSIFKFSLSITICITAILFFACTKLDSNKKLSHNSKDNKKFKDNTLLIKDNNSVNKIHGQVLYLPVYSNVPYYEHGRKFDLSAFVAVHNTDLDNSIKITNVIYFDNDGKFVKNFIYNDTIIKPLGTINFFVPEEDQSGTGANFIVEWVSDSLVNEPLIESVMLGLASGQGLSFSSTGKVIRQLR